MNQADRDQIQKNIKALSKLENVSQIAELLVEKGKGRVIDHEFYERIKCKFHTPKSQNEEFFLMLTKRGPDAFSMLVDVLMETGRISEAKLLAGTILEEDKFNAIHPQRKRTSVSSLEPESPLSPSEESFSGSENSHGHANGSYGCSSGVKFHFETPESSPCSSYSACGKSSSSASARSVSEEREPQKVGSTTSPKLKMKNLRISDDRGESPIITTPIKPATVYNQGQFDDKAYPMMSKPRGYALIVNNIEFPHAPNDSRTGAEYDSENLFLLFSDLGFEVTARHNVTRSDFMDPNKGIITTFLNQFSTVPSVDACIVAIMSHGSGDHIRTADPGNTHLHLYEDIIQKFNNTYCPALRDKPKIFIVQACRGDNRDHGIRRTQTDGRKLDVLNQIGYGLESKSSTGPARKSPSHEDIIVCYSTVPGYVANRDIEKGTWYVKLLCEVIREFAHELEFQELLREVGKRMRDVNSEFGEKQMSCYTPIGFHRQLYFNPQLFADE